jgi:hypothetical protein
MKAQISLALFERNHRAHDHLHRHGQPIADDEVVQLHDHDRFEIVSEQPIAIRIAVDEETVVVHHRTNTGATSRRWRTAPLATRSTAFTAPAHQDR